MGKNDNKEDEKTLTPVNQEQYLTFKLDEQDYGIPIIKIKEIKGWSDITPVPNTPGYIKGVINLRGTIVPIIDMRLRFNLKQIEYDTFTVIMVVKIGQRIAGLVVDSVSDVITMSEDQFCHMPEFEDQINREYIQGLAQVEGKLLIILNVDNFVKADTLESTVAASADEDNDG